MASLSTMGDDGGVHGVVVDVGGRWGRGEVVVEGGGLVTWGKKKMGGAYLGRPSSSFLAVPPRPRDVGLRGGIAALRGRWGKARGSGMVVVEKREATCQCGTPLSHARGVVLIAENKRPSEKKKKRKRKRKRILIIVYKRPISARPTKMTYL